MEKRVYTVKELSTVLSIGLNKAYSLINDGDIRSIKIKSSIRIPINEVERFLNNSPRVEIHDSQQKNETIQPFKHRRSS